MLSVCLAGQSKFCCSTIRDSAVKSLSLGTPPLFRFDLMIKTLVALACVLLFQADASELKHNQASVPLITMPRMLTCQSAPDVCILL